MRTDREAARKLRLQGKSYTEIQRLLGVPKSTLSTWFSHLILSEKLQAKIQQRTSRQSLMGLLVGNRAQTDRAIRRARSEREVGRSLIGELSDRELLLVGTALYWAEGYKRPKLRNGRPVTHHPVSLTNADPVLIQLFLRFLRRLFKVSDAQIKISIRMFAHQNETTLRMFWSGQTGITAERIQVTFVTLSRSSAGKRPYNRLEYGVAQVRVNDTRLYHQIMGAIEGLKAFR
jgi:hypothetical protein